jgi:hypothetical protein
MTTPTPAFAWDDKNGALTLSARTWAQGVLYTPWTVGTNYPWNFQGVIYSVTGTTFDAGQNVACYGQAIKESNTAPTQLWAGCFDLRDLSGVGLAGPNESRIGVEIDVSGNGPANGGTRAGVVINMSREQTQPAPVEHTLGFGIFAPSSLSDGTVATGFSVGGQIKDCAVDLSYVELPADGSGIAIHLPDNAPIAVSRDAKAQVLWDAPSGRFRFLYGGVPVFSVDTAGNVLARGTVTGGVAP